MSNNLTLRVYSTYFIWTELVETRDHQMSEETVKMDNFVEVEAKQKEELSVTEYTLVKYMTKNYPDQTGL